MKIGLGITTFNRPKHRELCYSSADKTRNNTIDIYIADDSIERKGIAFRKNECLRHFKGYDFVFLVDDDVVFLKTGWAEFFIEASKASGQQHFQYLKETPTIKLTIRHPYQNTILNRIRIFDINHVNTYNNTAGCFMFMTKECIEKVGAYNHNYSLYGWEHAGYSNRIHKAGLTPLGAYTCPAGAEEYIYSMDLQNNLPFNKQVAHKSSIEIKEGLASIQKNKEIYLQDTEIYIPL